MQIRARRNAWYKEVIVEDGCSKIESGLLDTEERIKMAQMLREAADELMIGIEESEPCAAT